MRGGMQVLRRWVLLLMLSLSAGLLAAGCDIDKEDPTFENPYDPTQGSDLAVPDSVRVAVGDAAVQLSWRMPAGETAEEYAVLRRTPEVESEEEERLLAKVRSPEYTDTRVRNGRTYVYRIAAGKSGRFGPRTAEIDAKPGLYTMVLADDKPVTKERSVSVGFNAPSASAVRLSEDPARFDRPWHPAGQSLQWQLSVDDGPKTVYAEFQFADGSTSLPTSDSILLDTKAAIASVSFEGSTTRRPGESVHFRIVAGETKGTATITVEGILDNVALYDDGTGGDRVSGDGTYEGDRVLSTKDPVTRAQVRGSFTDEAGNVATGVVAPELLTVRPALEPVSLIGGDLAEPPADPSVTLHWTLCDEAGFSAYRLYRAETAAVDSTDRLVTTVQTSTTLEAQDSGVVEGKTYFYRVYTQDTAGAETGSNVLEIRIPNLRNPSAVTIESGTSSGATRIAVQWNRSDATDFHQYRLYTNDDGGVDDTDSLLLETAEVGRTLFVHGDLIENTSHYYRVYVVDEGGLKAPSNEVEIITKNEAPPAVVMNEAANVDSASVTLSWTRSEAHDFAHYRLYRDENSTVTTGSTQVVEIDEPASTSYRDHGLEKGTRYYYRVFVFDDASDSKSTGSNTVTVQTSE